MDTLTKTIKDVIYALACILIPSTMVQQAIPWRTIVMIITFISVMSYNNWFITPLTNKTVTVGIIENIGTCSSSICAVKVNVDGSVEFWQVRGNVLVGQPVYKHCWNKGEQGWCKTIASTRVLYDDGFSL